MMKTKYLLSALLLVVALSVSNMATAQIRLGVKGGFDVADNKLEFDMLKASNRLGFYVGPTLEFVVPLSGFGGDVAVLYGRKEYKVEDQQNDVTLSDYNYISVPINIKQRFRLIGFGLFISGGVYGNVKIDGGDIKDVNAGDVVEEYKHKNFIFGLGAGAGVTLFSKLDLGIYFRGDLTKNYKEENISANTFENKKNQTWSVGLNYYF